MSRELRRVPPGWEPPKTTVSRLIVKNETGDLGDFMRAFANPRYEDVEEYHPHRDVTLKQAQEEWDNDTEGFDPVAEGYTVEEYYGDRPSEASALFYRPDWSVEEATHYRVYETVSEGSPVSPTFATLDEVVAWLVEQGYSETAARAFCESGYAPSMVVVNQGGTVTIKNDIASLDILR